MLPIYVQCDHPNGDDGICGVTTRRVPGRALNWCPTHLARLPYWPADDAELRPTAPKDEAEGGAAP